MDQEIDKSHKEQKEEAKEIKEVLQDLPLREDLSEDEPACNDEVIKAKSARSD